MAKKRYSGNRPASKSIKITVPVVHGIAKRQTGVDRAREQRAGLEGTKIVTIYTDGACEPNPGAGGYAAVILTPDAIFEFSGHEPSSTNNRMEVMAAIEAVNLVAEGADVTIYTDSRYLVNAASKWIPGWKRRGWRNASGQPTKNVDLWLLLEAAVARHSRVQWRWVKGHAGNVWNERADRLAQAASAGFEVAFGPARPERAVARSNAFSSVNF